MSTLIRCYCNECIHRNENGYCTEDVVYYDPDYGCVDYEEEESGEQE